MPQFIRKPVPKGLICLGFEESKPKSWLMFQKCHYSSDIWPRLELNRCQKLFFASVKIEPRPKSIFCLGWNWTATKNRFSASVKTWIEAKRFIRVQKSGITFFPLLPRVRVLSLSHPPPLLLLHSDHSQLLDVLLIRVLAWRSAIWGSWSGHQFVVLQVRGRLVLCMDGDLSVMVARPVGGGSVKKLVIAKEVVSRFGGGDAI